ncbi:MAG: prolyl oligopeptidase family serine peptidase [Candidatus Bathycorpusculaceae bacterium]
MAERILNDVEKVLRIPDLTLVDVSKNGRFALFLSNISGSYQLWSIDMQKSSTNQVSHGDQRVTFAEISPESKSVVFSRDFGGAERHQLFLVPISGQVQEEQISKLEDVRVFDFAWSPAGKEIVLTGSTFEANFLWLFDVKSRNYKMLYKSKGWIFSPQWSKDSQKLVASAKTTDKPRSAELLLLNIKNKKAEVYTPKLGSENTSPKWHPNKDQILFKTNAFGFYDLAIYDINSKSLTCLDLSKFGGDLPFFDWTKDGKALWFVAAKNGRTKLYFQKIGDKPVELQLPNGRISNIKLDQTGSLFIFSWSSLSQPPMISKLNIKTKALETVYKPSYDESIPLGKAEFLTYKSFDGLEIPSFMLFAKGSKKPKPCIVWPHGGPWWEVADEWNAAIQALCVGGFHVFCPNFRGSTGYGSEFERMNIKDPGGGDLKDIVFGVKFLMNSGFVEDEKVAIAGASYGGFMTFLAMTKVPDLWKAGAAIVGVTDWKEMYELSDAAFRSFIEELLGKPEENPKLFRDRSAINFVHQIKSPILIWHRANDSRCPLKPIERFIEKLKELKKPYEFHVVEDEGHGPQKIDNLVKQYRYVVAFMLKHLS